MVDAGRVRPHQGTGNLTYNLIRLLRVQRAFAVESSAQIFPLEIFHHDERGAVPNSVIEDVDDVCATNLSGRFRLTLEPNAHLFVSGLLGIDQLDCTLTVE